MKPKELKELRHSFDFTQKQMAEVLGIKHYQNYQAFESGKNPIPKYIVLYSMSLTTLNDNRLLKKHIDSIGVDL